MKKILALIILNLFLLLWQSSIFAADPVECSPVHGAVVHCVSSKLIEQEYKLLVNLPESYKSNSKKKYPVIYVLDAQWDFDLMKGINGKLRFDKNVPEAIIVGITWEGKDLNIDKLRKRDFSPARRDSKGAGLFLQVLENELIPNIESRYANNNTRVISGSSLGGLFTTYAMLKRPNLFNKVISLAPAYRLLKKRDKLILNFAENLKNSEISFYLGCGEFDGCNRHAKKIAQALDTIDLDNFEQRLHLIEGIGHAATTPIGNTHGLIFVFNDK